MLCQRCHRHLHNNNCERSKCNRCESKFKLRCANESVKDVQSSGDRAYQWECALCHNPDKRVCFGKPTTRQDKLLNAINVLSEKLELMNKIQIPKLSNELQHLKTVSDNVFRQNEHILSKIDERKDKVQKPINYNKTSSSSQTFRKRNLNLTPNLKSLERNDDTPILPLAEKTVRFRPRRRSYVLNKMFHLLNRKLYKTTSPRKRY